MLETIAIIVQLIFSNTIIIQGLKAATDHALKRWEIRAILGVMSLFGIIATSVITGNDINFDSIGSIAGLVVQALMVGFGSHLSYKVIRS